MTTRSPPWSEDENRALVALYFTMLRLATTGGAYNKAAMIREANQPTHPAGFKAAPWTGELRERKSTAVEFKLMNATACHISLGGEVTMQGFGYQPLKGYQGSLKSAMALKLETRRRCYVTTGKHAA